MAFNESFVTKETNDKQEAIAEALQWFQQEEKEIFQEIENKNLATNENTEKESLNYKFLQKNSDILELMNTYWLKLDAGKKNLSFDVNIPNREDWTIKWYNNYDIILTKKWVSVITWELEIPWLFNDEEYNTPQKIDKIVDTIHNRILEQEQSNNNRVTEQTKENLENKMNAVKKVCKKLFQ